MTTEHDLKSFTDLPKGCFVHPVRDNAHWPLIQSGQFAVVDRNDTEYVSGRLYLFKYDKPDGGEPYFHIWEIRDFGNAGRSNDQPCVSLSPTNRPPKDVDFDDWIRNGGSLHLSDGPVITSCLPDRIQGRVIGVPDNASIAKEVTP